MSRYLSLSVELAHSVNQYLKFHLKRIVSLDEIASKSYKIKWKIEREKINYKKCFKSFQLFNRNYKPYLYNHTITFVHFLPWQNVHEFYRVIVRNSLIQRQNPKENRKVREELWKKKTCFAKQSYIMFSNIFSTF